jgi:hypothetical protein
MAIGVDALSVLCRILVSFLVYPIIRTYSDFSHKIRDKDNVTSHVLREMLEDEIRQEGELELVLAVDDKRCSHIR